MMEKKQRKGLRFINRDKLTGASASTSADIIIPVKNPIHAKHIKQAVTEKMVPLFSKEQRLTNKINLATMVERNMSNPLPFKTLPALIQDTSYLEQESSPESSPVHIPVPVPVPVPVQRIRGRPPKYIDDNLL